MSKLVIGVTGINAGDNPAPGVGVAKSLKEDAGLDAIIAGLAYDAMEPGIYMEDFVDKAFLIPYPSAEPRALLDRLLYIRARFGLDVVVPTLDSELPFYIRYRETLAGHGIRCFLPQQSQFDLRSKVRLAKVAATAGIAAPRQELVTDERGLPAAIEKLGLPLVVKGAMYRAYHAYTAEEVLGRFRQVAAQWGYPVILQETIQGEEMNVVGVGDGDGRTLGLVAVKKMTVTELGKIWTGITISHPTLLDAARRFVSFSRWSGAFEMECIVSDDRVWLIEINPRFPAWVYFATGVGVNLPAMLVRRALAQPVEPSPEYAPGRLYVRFTGERICDLNLFQQMVTRGESL